MTGAFVNAVYPGPDQIADMQKPGPDGPIVMVNLLKFREKAQYADGRETDLSGHAAYQLYGRVAAKLVEMHGGKILYVGDVSFLGLGKCNPLWDEVALAQYPSRKALWEMSISSEWREAAVHREAGLEGQLNIETTPTFIAGARG